MNRVKFGFLSVITLTAMLLLTSLPAGAAASTTPSLIFEEGADEASFADWSARWQKIDVNAASSVDTWCRQGHEFHGGKLAAYCSKSGYNSHYLTATNKQPMDCNLTGLSSSSSPANMVLRYDTNQDSIMRKYVSGAKYYTNLTLTFWFYSDTGASDAKQPGTGTAVGHDFLNVIYYTGTNSSLTKHVLWTDSKEQASSRTWTKVTLDVPNTFVWIGFEFVSGTVAPQGGDASTAFSAYGVRTVPAGSTGMREGVFLDDIALTGYDNTAPTLKVTSPSSGAVVNTSSVAVKWAASDLSGIAYYQVRLDSGSWTRTAASAYTYAAVPNGAHTVTVLAVDGVGNSRSVAVKFTVKV